MAKYSDIKGFTVQTLASDTAASSIGAGSWSSSANAPYTIERSGGFGAQTAAVVAGGFSSTTDSYIQTTIEFNGSSWSSGGTMNRPAGQSTPAFGTEPSGGVAGGYKTSGNAVVNNFESYNGTAFTESTDINTARQAMGATGASSTSGIVAGGTTSVSSPPSAEGVTNVELWNGSSWTEIAEINTKRHKLTALGSTCPAPTCLVAGGEDDANFKTNVELYNGTNWTEVNEINVNRSEAGGAGSTSTDGLYFGGYNPPSATALTEHWNGTNWTEVADMSTARYAFGAGTGTSTLAIAAGGAQPGASATTESWSAPPSTGFNQITQGQLFFNSTANAFKETILDIPATSWSSGGSLNTARGYSSGAGTQTAALCISGGPGNRANVEQYNGSSWTETTDVNADRLEAGAFGGYTSANYVGGYDPGTATRIASNESWNGSSWTEVNDLPTATDNLMQGAGTQTAGMIVGGVIPTPVKTTNNIFYDGTNWTASSSLNSGRALGAVSGSQTSALVSTGLTGPPSSPSPTSNTANVETWDGSSWTEVSNVNTQRYRVVGSGDAGSGLIFAGTNYPSTAMSAKTESWNGTTWSEINDLSTAREAGSTTSGTGSTAASTLLAGGTTPSVQSATEEWTSDLANKTITTS